MLNLRRTHRKSPATLLAFLLFVAMLPAPVRPRVNVASPTVTSEPETVETKRTRASESYGRLPLSFEMNKGQTDKRVKFSARGAGYGLFLTGTDAVLSLRHNDGKAKDGRSTLTPARLNDDSSARGGKRDASSRESAQSAIVRMQLIGMNDAAQVTGEDEQAGKSNYFIGNDATQWRTDVAHYSKVRYRNVYAGIDHI